MTRLELGYVLLLLSAGCLDKADFRDDASCPCVADYVCCPSLQSCRPAGMCPQMDVTELFGFTPRLGGVEGGTILTLTGDSLENVAKVLLGDQLCPTVAQSEHDLRCRSRANGPGNVRVTAVLKDGARIVMQEHFRYRSPPMTVVGDSGITTTFGRGLTVFDANGDGRLDILVGENGTPRRSLHENLGNLRFAPASAQPPLPTDPFNGATAADFDQDGRVDLFYWPQAGTGADGLLVATTIQDVPLQTGITGVQAADLDGDGLLDLIGCRDLVSQEAPAVFLAWGDGATFEEADTSSTRSMPTCNSAAVGDFDRDQDPDLLVCGQQFGLFENRGGTFVDATARRGLPQTTRVGNRYNCESTGFHDYDADGDLDVWIATTTWFGANRSAGLLIYENHEDEGLEEFSAVRLLDERTIDIICEDRRLNFPADPSLAGGSRSAAWLDFDLDGDLDIFVPIPSHQCGDEPWLYESRFAQGEATFEAHVLPGIGVLGGVAAAVAADFDGDGDQDVVTRQGDRRGGRSLYRNQTRENGIENRYLAVRAPPGSTVEIDMDGPPSDPDFALGRGRLQVRTISGDGFAAQPPPIAHFGLGDRTEPVHVRLIRSDGTEHVEPVTEFDRTITLR